MWKIPTLEVLLSQHIDRFEPGQEVAKFEMLVFCAHHTVLAFRTRPRVQAALRDAQKAPCEVRIRPQNALGSTGVSGRQDFPKQYNQEV